MEALSSFVDVVPLASSTTAGVPGYLELPRSDRAADDDELLPEVVLSRKWEEDPLSAIEPLPDLNRPEDLARGGERGSSRLEGDEASVDDIVLLLDLLRRLRADIANCLVEEGLGK